MTSCRHRISSLSLVPCCLTLINLALPGASLAQTTEEGQAFLLLALGSHLTRQSLSNTTNPPPRRYYPVSTIYENEAASLRVTKTEIIPGFYPHLELFALDSNGICTRTSINT